MIIAKTMFATWVVCGILPGLITYGQQGDVPYGIFVSLLMPGLVGIGMAIYGTE